jgi:hypothetical protein
MKAIAFTLAAGALGLAFAGSASALPLAPVAQAASETSDIQLVRDGCGRGLRYSNRRDRCVRIRDRDVRRDDDGDAAAVDTAIGIIDSLVGSRNDSRLRNGKRGKRTRSKSATSTTPPAPNAPPPVVKGSSFTPDVRTQTEKGTLRNSQP